MKQASVEASRAVARRKPRLPTAVSVRYGLAVLSVSVALGGALQALANVALKSVTAKRVRRLIG